MKRNLLFLFVLIACSAFGQGSGEVIITEIHNRPLKPSDAQLAAALPNNPAGADTSPNEGHTEWFEVYNTTSQDIDMEGWILLDASSSSRVSTISNYVLPANSYAVFSGFNIPEAQGGVQFDYFYDYKEPSFNNESSYADAGDNACPDGVTILKPDSSLVDEVLYDYGYGEYIGNPDAGECMDATAAVGIPSAGSSSRVSFMLIGNPDVMNAADNDLAANWTYSTVMYDIDGGQIGTPGMPNGGFGGGTGEVIITEIYNRPLKPTDDQLAAALPNNPAGADTAPNEGHTEWFEVFNTTNQDVVMDGWTIGDLSSSSRSSVISSYTLPANSYAVFSGFDIPEAQGGYQFDYFYGYKMPSFNNESSYADPGDKNCPDGVSLISADGELVDEVQYDYGYGEYIGNPDAGACMDAAAAIGMPPAMSAPQVSFMLKVDPAVMNATSNNSPSNWIYSTNVYDTTGVQIGTPGLPNDAVTSTVSNKEIYLSSKVSIFPNPGSTTMNVVSDLEEDFTIQLFDVFGKNISENRVGNNTIDVSQISNGMYLVKLNFERGSVTKKITVQH